MTNPSMPQGFDIRNFTDRLTPVEGKKDRYYCPVCDGNNFTVNPANGSYQCWNGCENKEIRNTVAPLERSTGAAALTSTKPIKTSPTPPPPPAKPARAKADRTWAYTDRQGNAIIQTRRLDDGQGKRRIWQEYRVDGQWVSGGKAPEDIKAAHKQAVTPYRYLEALEAVKAGAEVVIWAEGEPCCDALWALGIPAITSIGGSKSYANYGDYRGLLAGFPASLVVCPDQDAGGLKYAQAVADDLGLTLWLKPWPDSPTWANLPNDKGLDIADWVDEGATAETIRAAVAPLASDAPTPGPRGFTGAGDLLTAEQVRQQLERLILEGVKDSDIQIAIAELSKQSGFPPHAIKSIYQALLNDTELSAATARAGADLQQLETVREVRLPIEAGLFGDGGQLASKIRQVAEAMPTAPEFLVTTLIPVLATAMGTAQTLVIHATAGYKASPIFRSIIVAPTGRKKTPAQMAIVRALTELETSAALDHAFAMGEYDADYRAWAKASKGGGDDAGPEPSKPTRKRYLTQDSTLAARIQIHAENPRGLLLYKDEASAFITERGRFTSGKGDGGEFEADLSEFNGGSIMCDRKGDGSTFLAKSAINRVGATQYSTLQKLMGNHDDDCGEFARYLFCAAEAPPSKIDLTKDAGDIGLTSDVMLLFTRLSEMPERAYLLDPDAKQAFQAYQHELTDRAIAEDHPSLQSAYPKFETYFGRFIIWLHLVNAALADQAPAATVDGYTVELARQWTEYFIAQLKLVLAINSPQQELTGDLLKVYDYLRRKGKPLDIRGISQGRLFSRNPDKSKQGTAYLRGLLGSLVEQGWVAEQEGLYRIKSVEQVVEQVVEQPVEQLLNMLNIPTGQGFQPPVEHSVEQNVEHVEQMLSSAQHTQKPTGQGFQPFVEQNVEQLSRNRNKNGNGNGAQHHSLDISDEKLAQLLGGDSYDN